jgi:hypothetical protein
VVPESLGINGFSMVEKTFIWRRHDLSSRSSKKAIEAKREEKTFEENWVRTTPSEWPESFFPELSVQCQAGAASPSLAR